MVKYRSTTNSAQIMSDHKSEFLTYGRALSRSEIVYLACYPLVAVVTATFGYVFVSAGGAISPAIGLALWAGALHVLRRTIVVGTGLSQGRPALIVTRDHLEHAPLFGDIVRRELRDLAHFEVTCAQDTWPRYAGRGGTIYALRAKPVAPDQPGLEINSFGLAKDRSAVIRMADDIAALRSDNDPTYAAYAAKRDQENAFNDKFMRHAGWFMLWFLAFIYGATFLAMWLAGR